MQRFLLLTIFVVHIADQLLDHYELIQTTSVSNNQFKTGDDARSRQANSIVLFAEAKGVAGLGKAGNDNQGGPDKGGQKVPPEVYKALTYAGSLFLLTLSVPLILYGLNKLLNLLLECLGCRSSNNSYLDGSKTNQDIRQEPLLTFRSISERNLVHSKGPFDNYANHQEISSQLANQPPFSLHM